MVERPPLPSLFAPTERPNEPVTAGLGNINPPMQTPEHVRVLRSLLAMHSTDPDVYDLLEDFDEGWNV